jgi:biopolymer transport protein TolR
MQLLNDADKEPLTVTIDREGRIFPSGNRSHDRRTGPAPDRDRPQRLRQRILVRGDTAVDYGAVMKVMGELNVAGFRRIRSCDRPAP